MTNEPEPDRLDLTRAFGATNRARLLDRYFSDPAAEAINPQSAWRHVYRLLMWTDRTIGLAHCYESDKCQPGRPWYSRSLRFHVWLSERLQTTPALLANEIDWLFAAAVQALTLSSEARASSRRRQGLEQRTPYEGLGLPLPGEDKELEFLISHTIAEHQRTIPGDELVRQLSERVQAYTSSENKRKNLVGEGFEDSLAEIVRRIPALQDNYEVFVRPSLHELPGFNPPRGGTKTKKVDLALVRRSDGWRVLVSCKWSVRSDREEQFATDFDAYAHLESSGKTFGYVLITNEFDPARLAAACENRLQNAEIFSNVVHVNPDGLRAAYEAPLRGMNGREGGGLSRALRHVESGRLQSLESWLGGLSRA